MAAILSALKLVYTLRNHSQISIKNPVNYPLSLPFHSISLLFPSSPPSSPASNTVIPSLHPTSHRLTGWAIALSPRDAFSRFLLIVTTRFISLFPSLFDPEGPFCVSAMSMDGLGQAPDVQLLIHEARTVSWVSQFLESRSHLTVSPACIPAL